MSHTAYGRNLESTLFPALRAGAVAVTGTSRLQRRLRFGYGEWRRAAQDPVWRRPAIFSFEQWLRQLWELSLVSGGKAGRHALLPPHGSLMLWEQALAADSVAGFDREQSVALARRSWQLALEFGLDLDSLRGEADGEDERRFVRWAARFEELRLQGNWLEAAALPGILTPDLQSGAIKAPGPLYFLGTDDPLPAPRAKLMDALRSCGVEIRTAPQPPRAGRICQVAYETLNEELEAAALWSQSGDCGIVMLDFKKHAAAARRAVLNRLRPGWQTRGFPDDAPVNSAEAHPLSDFGPAESALDALSMLQRTLDMDTVSRVLRGAYLRGSLAEAGGRARLERELRDAVVGTHISRTQLLTRAAPLAPRLADALRNGWRASRKAGGKGKRRSHRTWSAAFMAFLNTLGWPGARTLSSAEQQAVVAWSSVMGQFSACDSIAAGSVTLEQALTRLNAIARERRFQPQGPDEAVELIPVTEAAGMHFGRLWVAGASAGEWPRSSRPEPLLPLRTQRRLNIPQASPQGSLQQARQQTQGLMHAADEVVFSWVEVAEGGVTTTCSPLVADVPVAPQKEVIGGSEQPDYAETLRRSAKLKEIESDTAPSATDSEDIGGGTGLIDAQLRSPFHAFVQYRLHARNSPQAWDGLAAMHRGQMMHRLLFCLYSEYSESTALQAALEQRAATRSKAQSTGLENQLAEWASDIPKVEPLGLRPLVSGLLRLERERAVALAMEWARENAKHGEFTVQSVEEFAELTVGRCAPGVGQPSGPNEETSNGIVLTLRLDRVDQSGKRHSRVVLDYKTGSRSTLTLASLNPRRLRSSQLPAYALATPEAAAVAYIHLSEDPPGVIGVHDFEADLPYAEEMGLQLPWKAWKNWDKDWAKTLEKWKETLDAAGRSILAGDARVEIFSKDARRFRQYDILSRRHELERNAT